MGSNPPHVEILKSEVWDELSRSCADIVYTSGRVGSMYVGDIVSLKKQDGDSRFGLLALRFTVVNLLRWCDLGAVKVAAVLRPVLSGTEVARGASGYHVRSSERKR